MQSPHGLPFSRSNHQAKSLIWQMCHAEQLPTGVPVLDDLEQFSRFTGILLPQCAALGLCRQIVSAADKPFAICDKPPEYNAACQQQSTTRTLIAMQGGSKDLV